MLPSMVPFVGTATVPEATAVSSGTALLAVIVACVAIAGIAACVAIVLGLKALDKTESGQIPQTLGSLFKGLGVFARFLPTTALRTGTMQNHKAGVSGPATASADGTTTASPAAPESPAETGRETGEVNA